MERCWKKCLVWGGLPSKIKILSLKMLIYCTFGKFKRDINYRNLGEGGVVENWSCGHFQQQDWGAILKRYWISFSMSLLKRLEWPIRQAVKGEEEGGKPPLLTYPSCVSSTQQSPYSHFIMVQSSQHRNKIFSKILPYLSSWPQGFLLRELLLF